MKNAAIDVAYLEGEDLLAAAEAEEERSRNVTANLRQGAIDTLNVIPNIRITDVDMPGVIRVECDHELLPDVQPKVAARLQFMIPRGRIASIMHAQHVGEGEGI